MYKAYSQSGKSNAYVNDYVADKTDDIQDLPRAPECAMGSTCLVLEDSSVWMLGADNEWHEI